MTPLIAVPCRFFRSAEKEWSDICGARVSYLQAVQHAGGCPLLVPTTDDLPLVRRIYDIADGVLLAGGEDVAPELYGEELLPTSWSKDDHRDAVEYSFVQWAFQDKKPLLGICRGAQIINIALGGSLFQDLPTQLNCNHDYIVPGDSVATMRPVHAITLLPGSLLSRLLGSSHALVNSVHHQAIRRVANGLRAVGFSDDGVVEAIEAEDRSFPFLLGVQCHPELLWQEHDIRWRNVFSSFIEESRHNACLRRLKPKEPTWIARIANR
jgi:putative glutamine amidotransferase